MSAGKPSLLRARGGHDSSRVGMVELFFDLVFVFAVTQLSHTLLAHLDLAGALHAGFLLLAVWWVWIYTSWVTNWLDPERIPVRLMLLALMLGGLVLSASIPKAFGEHAPWFACAYVAMQLGRTLFMLWASREAPVLRRNFLRILVWLMASALLWLAGGFCEEGLRWAFWLPAMALEIVSPMLYFRVPGLGRSTTADWNVDGSHLAERCALFVIIALGESLLVTGATFSSLTELHWSNGIAFLAAFVGSVAMWWIYFDTGAERAHHRIAHSDDPGRQARSAYTYFHLPIVAGIIVCAVADELAMVHPDHADNAGIAAIIGGPALYLVGTALFKWVTNNRILPPLSHLGGLVLLAALAVPAFSHAFTALQLGIATTGVMVIVATWESLALRRPAKSS
ncbi:MAG TPA: low temperature requirement protein A [Pseudoxanthomonas sp.]|nr:low temperature requirement protein A [Pseudoxanthomonas sp.]